MQLLTPQAVQTTLQQLGLNIQMCFYDTTTATSQQAADNIGWNWDREEPVFYRETEAGGSRSWYSRAAISVMIVRSQTSSVAQASKDRYRRPVCRDLRLCAG
jgi:hypothetical protein